MFIVSIEYIRPLAEIEAALPEHIAYLERYYRAGLFLMSGRKQPRTILMQADSRGQVEQTIAEDPFHRAGLAEYSITEFLPTKTADSLAQHRVQA